MNRELQHHYNYRLDINKKYRFQYVDFCGRDIYGSFAIFICYCVLSMLLSIFFYILLVNGRNSIDSILVRFDLVTFSFEGRYFNAVIPKIF
jgi:hypothetical protein